MSPRGLTEEELGRVRERVEADPVSVAIVRTEHAPTELKPLLDALAEVCRMRFVRTSWSPSADFGFAEFNSDDKILILLWIGGSRTELVSVSAADDALLESLEESIRSSKFCSEVLRHGT